MAGAPKAVAEPVSADARSARRTGRDWTARTRDTALSALRYSRFVTVMKRVLPVAVGVLILAIVAYSLVPRQSDRAFTMTSEGTLSNDLAMIKPRLTGADRKGNPFVITADMAIQDGANVRRATLKNVQADVTLDDNRWLNATAVKGYVDMDKGTLALSGGIAVFSDDGYEIHTARADVDLRQGTMHGPSGVTGHGPSGTLSADTFELDRKTQQLVLNGNVHMTLTGGHRK